ncbi:hypothetical protein PoB_007366200 [Plakobranchus ocellatus]|uniref:Uncharacterized protein n=1 Tax=Plakobranchus ocellatus TaxID=259542 RepID=A0AAV4DS69_9GAST|nr:hypothetical protein PoB_007366200 [Plakobranchus ocellatus]
MKNKPSTNFNLRQQSVATILMMIRVMCRVHNELAETWTDKVDIKLKHGVLLGDMVGAGFIRALAEVGIPQVTGMLFTAISDLFCRSFLPNPANGGSHDKKIGHFGFEDTPIPLQLACEAIVLEAGMDKKLRDHVGKFAHHISLARFMIQDKNMSKQPPAAETAPATEDPESHNSTAMSHLAVFSQSRQLSMLKRLAHVYVFG